MKSQKLLFILSLFLFGTQFELTAAHIIGGELTYECLGNDQYKFTMKIYRDCLGGGAEFDSAGGGSLEGSVSVYEGQGNTAELVKTIYLGSPVITPIAPNVTNPCLVVPTGVCVEEGVYTFTLTLSNSPESYNIAYQRCCRNNTIANIVAPGDSGATYTIELTPEAQDVCNSSPVFNNFPPIVICAGSEINFDHSATDPDGDVLEYSLCTPYLGGGNNQQQPFVANGVAPDPDLPPPYTPVVFSTPYSFNNPLGGLPPNNLTIDSNTGLLNGIPMVGGQFVVGVCVTEKRNGVVLSTVRRDFQFNVTTCEPTVQADIAEDSLIIQGDDQIFYVRACGGLDVNIQNTSFQQSNISNYYWEFDIPGSPNIKLEGPSFANWSPTINFPGVGQYNGQLVLNPGLQCADSAAVIVDIFPAIYSDFEFEYDTCISNPVQFTDLSSSDAGPNTITSWSWNFGDGNSSTLQNPSHLYMIPGVLPASLTVTDINNCKITTVKEINYFPVPQLLVIAPSEYIGCQPASIFFENLSFPIDESYDILWDFGDGNTGTGISPTHIYQDLGTFTVSVDITSPIGCMTDTTWNDLITVLASPQADFEYAPDQPSNIQPLVTFTDKSIDAAKWRWDFSGKDFSFDQNPAYVFPDTGSQIITLIVTHESGCKDTTVQFLDVIPEVRYYLPNAFTPNGDGVNDLFLGKGLLEGATNFRMSIWNRYGEQLFETTDPEEGWNGRKNNAGKVSTQGVYIVVVTYTGPRNEKIEIRGYATLIR